MTLPNQVHEIALGMLYIHGKGIVHGAFPRFLDARDV